MANEHRVKNILLNYGAGVYQVGQVDSFSQQSTSLLGIDNKLTYLIMESYYDKVDQAVADWYVKYQDYPTNFQNNLESFCTSTGFTDDLPDYMLEWCDELIIWLWGGIKQGGYGIFKNEYNAGSYFAIFSCGIYTNGERNYILCESAWYQFTRNENPDVAFAYHYNAPINVDSTYDSYILVLTNSRDYNTCISYDAEYTGGADMYLVYNLLAPISNNALSGVVSSKTNDWQDEYILAPYKVTLNAIYRDSVWRGGRIYDDVHNEWSTLVHVSGHWYGDDYEEDPNDGDGGNGAQGGGGDYDKTNNPVSKTDLTQFTNDAFGTGFINVYNPTKSELLSLANILCTGVSKNISLMLKKLFTNPLDYIVALNMCHFNVTTGTAETVKLGGWDTGIAMNVIEKQFKIMNGGSLYIPHNFSNFLDYYVKTKIYIPYCGVHDLPTDLIMGGTLSIQYIVDCLTGAMVAELYLTRDRSGMHGVENPQTDGYMWSFSGNCFVPIPIGNLDYRNSINAVLGLVSGIGTTVATGNPAPIVGSVASAVMNGKPTFEVGSNIGSNYGYMTSQTAFVILQEPIQNRPTEYIGWRGYPSNTLHPIGWYHGYTEVDADTIWTDKFSKPITEEETAELKQILNNGFYV